MEPVPTIIVVNFYDTMHRFSQYTSLYEIYKRFPMQEVIRVLLTIPAFIDYSDIMFTETEHRFQDILDNIDLVEHQFILRPISV